MTETDPEPPSRLIEIDGTHASRPLDVAWLRAQLERAMDLLPRPVSRVTIALLCDARMRDLHRRHTGIDATTDVLTFAAADAPAMPDDAETPGAIDADIALCVDEAARQSVVRGHRIEQELLLYAIHGLLHCCGYDDHDPGEFDRMHTLEDRILADLGIGATYHATESTGDACEGASRSR